MKNNLKINNFMFLINNNSRIIVFFFVGLASAIIDVGVLYILKKIFLFTDFFSISIAFLSGLVFNYLCNTYLTFKSEASKASFIKYLMLVALNYLITLFLINTLVDFFSVGIILAKIISLPIIAIVSYSVSKIWVYK